MGAAYSGIADVSAGNVAAVLDINQFKQALEGQRDFVPLIWATDDNNIVLRIGDAAGANFLDIQDSAGISQFKVDSNGNITSTDILTSTRLARLTSDVVVSSAVLADVVGMSFAIGASESWTMQMFGMFDADGVPDITLGFTGPSGCAMTWAHTGDPTWNASGSTTINAPVAIGGTWDLAGQGAGSPFATTFAGTIVNGVTAGTIQLQYARLGASGSSTLKAETNIIFTKVS
tara:strand:+ start:2337 stop:3032 length:696 start_codon:yes stop_codon:yes gene_type:complete